MKSSHVFQDCIQNVIIDQYLLAQEDTTAAPRNFSLLDLGLELPAPEPYSGKDTSVRRLKSFVHRALDWLLLMDVFRLDRQQQAVLVVGTLLKGEAKRWYQYTVRSSQEEWNAFQVLEGLRRRFISVVDYADAADEFEDMVQGEQDVREYYWELVGCANCVLFPPGEYQIRRRFMLGLHSEIRKRVVLDGYSPEQHDLDTLYKRAVQVENAFAFARILEGSSKVRKVRSTY
jgi:hypothetical protein